VVVLVVVALVVVALVVVVVVVVPVGGSKMGASGSPGPVSVSPPTNSSVSEGPSGVGLAMAAPIIMGVLKLARMLFRCPQQPGSPAL
jgi:hypothetical protein